MGRAYLQHLDTPEERVRACQQVKMWGYPREIHEAEWHAGIWFAYRDRGLAWFTRGPWSALAIHACADPESKRSMGDELGMSLLEGLAELLGAKRLYVLDPKGEEEADLPAEAMRRYLRIRGWQRDEYGSYLELGED